MIPYILTFIVCLIKLAISQVLIVSPQKLKDLLPNEIIGSYSNFGSIPYGIEIRGKVYFDTFNKEQDLACKPYFNITSMNVPQPDVSKTPIILIDRGNCSFVTKVHNVEKIFGRAALIVNNDDEDVSRIIMSDDGKGEDITIPAVLINKREGDIIKNFFYENKDDAELLEKVIISINFDMPVENESTKIDIFYSSESLKVYKLLSEFTYYQVQFSDKDIFVPHFITSRSSYYNKSEEQNIINCVSSGKYCGIVPNEELGINNGTLIIFENLRQKCIYKYEKEKSMKMIFYNYMVSFYDRCLNVKPPSFAENCSISVMNYVGIDSNSIQKCIEDSFEDFLLYEYKDNKILQTDFKDKKLLGIEIYPGIMINNRTFFGTWNAINLLEASCSGVNDKPKICQLNNKIIKNESSSLSGLSLFFIIFFLIIFNLTVIYFCIRYISRKINERITSDDIDSKINNIVSNYLSLTENK